MHQAAFRFIAGTVFSFGVDKAAAVDLGGRDINGNIHGLFDLPVFVVDIVDGPGVDVVADAADWVPHTQFGVALCTEVFEHTPRWREIVATAYECLVPGGLFIATCATANRPPHGAATDDPLDGEYYQNVDIQDMRDVLADWSFSVARVADGVFGGDDLYAWALR